MQEDRSAKQSVSGTVSHVRCHLGYAFCLAEHLQQEGHNCGRFNWSIVYCYQHVVIREFEQEACFVNIS